MGFKDKFSKLLGGDSGEDEYIEIDLGQEEKKSKVIVRTFILRNFDDVNNILNTLREGYTIAIINYAPLKKKDLIELKRAVSKIKKTVEALEGSIKGFAENTIIATPQFAKIYSEPSQPKEHKKEDFY